MNINHITTQQQKERLIVAVESSNISQSSAHRIKVILENGDLLKAVSELNYELSKSK